MRRLIVAAALLAGPVTAHAATAFGAVSVDDCAPGTGVIDNAKIRTKMFEAAGVGFTPELAMTFANGKLLDVLEKASSDCIPYSACKGATRNLADFYDRARPLDDQPAPAHPDELLAPRGLVAKLGPGAPPIGERRARFLNGDWAWLTVACEKAPPVPQAAKVPPPRPAAGPALVIAKTEDDAGKEQAKRGYASIGYTSDRVADKKTYDVDLFVGVDTPFLYNSGATFQPFASLQLHSAKKVDDLSLGGALYFYPWSNGSEIRFKAAWETDHRFESSVWRADFAWTYDLCENAAPAKFYTNCELSFQADYADIADRGRKDSLKDLSSYKRVGGDMHVVLAHSVGTNAGFVIFDTRYTGLHDLGHDDADAERFTTSLGFAPAKATNFKVSVDYTEGRDLTDLSKEKKVVLTFGFRH